MRSHLAIGAAMLVVLSTMHAEASSRLNQLPDVDPEVQQPGMELPRSAVPRPSTPAKKPAAIPRCEALTTRSGDRITRTPEVPASRTTGSAPDGNTRHRDCAKSGAAVDRGARPPDAGRTLARADRRSIRERGDPNHQRDQEVANAATAATVAAGFRRPSAHDEYLDKANQCECFELPYSGTPQSTNR